MAPAAKMNFFRTVVTKTACKELQEHFAVLNHLKIRRGKKLFLCQHSIAHERKQLLLYPPNNGLQIKHCSSGDKFLRSPSIGLVMNTCGSGEKNTNKHQVKMVTRRKCKVVSITVPLPTVHTTVPGSFGHPIQIKDAELEDADDQRWQTWTFQHGDTLFIRGHGWCNINHRSNEINMLKKKKLKPNQHSKNPEIFDWFVDNSLSFPSKTLPRLHNDFFLRLPKHKSYIDQVPHEGHVWGSLHASLTWWNSSPQKAAQAKSRNVIQKKWIK